MPIKTIFFDLDDTLYPRQTGVWQAMRMRIGRYMHEVVGIPEEQVAAVREGYLSRFGTTLRGLQHEFAIDAEDYLRFVHDVPIEAMVAPNPALAAMLTQLPQSKFIFTNSVSFHAERVLTALGVRDCFESIIDVQTMQFHSKPDPFAYQTAYSRAAIVPGEALFVDDMPANLRPARQLGSHTVLVAPAEEQAPDAAHAHIQQAEQLLEALPALVEFAHG